MTLAVQTLATSRAPLPHASCQLFARPRSTPSNADAPLLHATLAMPWISGPVCAAHPLAWYAEGGTVSCSSSAQAQPIPRQRLALATRFVRDIRLAQAEVVPPGRASSAAFGALRFFLPSNTARMSSRGACRAAARARNHRGSVRPGRKECDS